MTAVLLISAGVEVPGLVQSAFTGKVVAVLDGDSLMVLDGRQQVEVRLHGVDAPEGGQAYGNVCKRTLSNLVFGRTAAVQVIEIDRFKRSVSRVTVDGRDVGLEMIRAGCAWHYRQYSNDASYAAAEEEARRARRGLWQDAKPVPPWTYRRLRNPGEPPLATPSPGSRTRFTHHLDDAAAPAVEVGLAEAAPAAEGFSVAPVPARRNRLTGGSSAGKSGRPEDTGSRPIAACRGERPSPPSAVQRLARTPSRSR